MALEFGEWPGKDVYMQEAKRLLSPEVLYGHPMFHKIVEEIRELHEAKNKQYATQDDPLGNFRRTGQIIKKMLKPGINPSVASCLAFMSKQVDGVYEMFGEDKDDCPDQLEDKLKDIAVYSIIAMILIYESRNRDKNYSMYRPDAGFVGTTVTNSK